jgi:osmotically-inducible protein OsmY
MTGNFRMISTTLAAALLAGAFFGVPRTLAASERKATVIVEPQQDRLSVRDAEARLNKSQFNNVKVSADNGIATLTGTVGLFEYKTDAEKRAGKAKGIVAVRNLIAVEGVTPSDRELLNDLVDKLSYDRVGFGNVFNAVSANVENGVVTLGGHARTYMDRDSAIALVSTTPGVKDVVGEIEVDPLSAMDDQIRMRVARAVYGYTSLSKYAIDPAKPIRISVQSGNVSLYGMVNSQADKDTANIRANGVAGIFSVNNYLQVAGQENEARR